MIYVFQVLALVAGAALASCGEGGASQDSSSAAAIDRVAEGCHAVPELRQQQVLLACEPFSRGRELQVRTERDSGGQEGCLEIYGMGRGKSRACGYVPYKRRPVPSSPIILDAVNQLNEASPIEIYGSTKRQVTAVTITYTDRAGKSRRAQATLFRNDDEASMRAANLARPFGYFVAELPPGSSRARATARAGGGRSMRTISLALDTYHPPFLYARE